MSRKPENTFIAGVNKHLPTVYFEKTNNPFRSGVADSWYSGELADLWVEYKYIPKIPMRSKAILPDLSPRQRQWLADRLRENRNVAVIVGCPGGGVLYLNGDWDRPLTALEFQQKIQTRQQLAQWIFSITGASPCKLFPRLPDSLLELKL